MLAVIVWVCVCVCVNFACGLVAFQNLADVKLFFFSFNLWWPKQIINQTTDQLYFCTMMSLWPKRKQFSNSALFLRELNSHIMIHTMIWHWPRCQLSLARTWPGHGIMGLLAVGIWLSYDWSDQKSQCQCSGPGFDSGHVFGFMTIMCTSRGGGGGGWPICVCAAQTPHYIYPNPFAEPPSFYPCPFDHTKSTETHSFTVIPAWIVHNPLWAYFGKQNYLSLVGNWLFRTLVFGLKNVSDCITEHLNNKPILGQAPQTPLGEQVRAEGDTPSCNLPRVAMK